MRKLKLTALCIALLAAAACGGFSGSGQPAPTATAVLSAADLLALAGEAAGNVSFFHFSLEHENGSSPLPLNLKLVSAEGDVVVPDRLQAEIGARAGSINLRVEAISIGSETWITNPFSRRWQALPGASLQDIADPTALIEAILSGLRDVSIVGEAELSGTNTRYLVGSLDSGALHLAMPFVDPGFPIDVELWLGIDDNLPRRARLSGPASQDEPAEIERIISFSQFDRPVEILPPE